MLSCFSRVRFFATLRTVARQAPLSVGFSRQEYWSGLPCPPPEELPDPGIKPVSYVSCIARGFFTTSATWEAHSHTYFRFFSITDYYKILSIVACAIYRKSLLFREGNSLNQWFPI